VRLGHTLLLIASLAGCAGGAKTPARLAERKPQSAPKLEAGTPAEVVRPCAKDSEHAKAARARIGALDAKIGALAANAPGEAVGKEIEAVLEGPCFALTTLPYPFELDSGLAVKQWWSDGGKWWLESQLALGLPRDPKAMSGTTHQLVVPPSTRKTLAADVQPKSPLLPLLCPAASALPDSTSSCGRETVGWMHRAAMTFTHLAEAKRAHFLDLSPKSEPPPTRDECLSKAKEAPAHRAFHTYADCVQATARRTEALPLGRYSTPKEGWLVLQGRRGHHGFCDEIRAYDLASGAAYVAKSCGGLIMKGGTVNGVATNVPRQPSVEVGKVPVEALREAALFALLSEEVDHEIVERAFGWSIPPEIEIAMPEDRGLTLPGVSHGWSSGRSIQAASWVLGGRSQARAAVHWPDADEPAREHAAELLAIAELGFVAGCAPAALPTLPWASIDARGNDEHDVPTFDDSPVNANLRVELARLRGRPLCGAGPTR
jgi:hypothetical protein